MNFDVPPVSFFSLEATNLTLLAWITSTPTRWSGRWITSQTWERLAAGRPDQNGLPVPSDLRPNEQTATCCDNFSPH